MPAVAAPTSETTDQFVQRIAQRELELSEAAEHILHKLADGTELSDAEYSLLNTFFNADDEPSYKDVLRSEVSRIKRIRTLQRDAGSDKARQEADRNAEKLSIAFEQRASEIDRQIQELQNVRRDLEKQAAKAKADADFMHASADKLRSDKFLPQYVKTKLRHRRRQHNERFRDFIKHRNDAEAKHNLLSKTDEELRQFITYRDWLSDRGKSLAKSYDDDLQMFRDYISDQLQEHQEFVERDEKAFEESQAELRQLYDHYVPE